MSRLCWKCQRVLPLEAFARDATTKDGLDRRCRQCVAQYKLEYRRRPHVRERQREHKRRHEAKPETLARKEQAKEAARRERDARKAQREAMLEEARQEIEAVFNQLGGEEFIRRLYERERPNRTYKRRFSEEQSRFRRKIRDLWKYHTNVHYLLKSRLAARLRVALKRNKNKRATFDLLPYTPEQLIRRLKRTIPRGYAWDDFLTGQLHIDHIVPVRAFNFSKPEHPDFLRCWALSNLRLLPARENSRKGGRLSAPFQPCLPLVGRLRDLPGRPVVGDPNGNDSQSN